MSRVELRAHQAQIRPQSTSRALYLNLAQAQALKYMIFIIQENSIKLHNVHSINIYNRRPAASSTQTCQIEARSRGALHGGYQTSQISPPGMNSTRLNSAGMNSAAGTAVRTSGGGGGGTKPTAISLGGG